MKRKKLAGTLAWSVENGALTQEQADGVFSLAKWCGLIAEPDAVARKKNRAERVKAMKRKSSPASLAGTKAGGLFNGARVKDAADRLCGKKHTITKHGRPLMWGNKTVETASEKDNAVIGVWWKRLMQKQGVPGVMLSDWERSLLADHIEKGKWVGDVPGQGYFGGGSNSSDYVPSHMVKALLDDTVSGGIFLNPIEFDANVVTIPLLHGEVFPMVDLVPVTARRIEGARMQNMGVQWGTNPGTAIVPFSTANLVSELSTPVVPVAGAIELDNNLLSDSPVNVGATVTTLFSERLKSELDRVVMNGNGIQEPLGIVNTAGLVTVTSDNGVGGPPTVSDYEGLLFSVPVQYRRKEWNCAYLANDTTYRRARGIQVGPGDERRVFGMDHESYTLLDYPYKIQNDIPNNRIIFGCWKRYRMYQRLGSEVVVTREGRQLALANTSLIVIRSRFGGQPIDPAAFALMSNAQQ